MKSLNLLFSVFLLLLFTTLTFAQEADPIKGKNLQKEMKLRPVRFGVKLGFPNLLGGNVEYLTPLLNNKLSANMDYSKFKSDWFNTEDLSSNDTDNLDYSFLDLGANYYFFKPGKGLYSGLSYSSIKFNGAMSYESDSNNEEASAIEYYDVKHSTVNLKVGARLGGLFYFRPEVGYSFKPIPKTVTSETVYSDGSRESTIYSLEDQEYLKPLLSGFTFNIGFGFAF